MFKGVLIRIRPVTLLILVLAIALGTAPIALAAQANKQTELFGLPVPTKARPAMAAARNTSTSGQSQANTQPLSVSIVNPAGPIPAPTITGLNPFLAAPGGPGFTLTVNGQFFFDGALVQWNGSYRATTAVSDTQLTAEITAADIAAPGIASVTAVNNPWTYPRESNTMHFWIMVGTPKKVYLPLAYKNPPAPVMIDIANADGDGNYTVSWTRNVETDSDWYTLEEDDNAAFSSPETRFSGWGTSWDTTDKALGTYYYRVQGSNAWGSTSGWSNVVSVVVRPASTPNPGFWQGTSDRLVIPVAFYVTADQAYVADFSTSVAVPYCAIYTFTHTIAEPISSGSANSFSFTGPFHASGRFISETTASGTLGFNSAPIPGCGSVSAGPIPWTASWKQSARLAPAEATETDRVAPANPNNAFGAARIP